MAKSISDTSKNLPETYHIEKTKTLEHIERLAVTLKYVLTGGKQFARGALAKSFGNKKALKMLDQITPISGFLQVSSLSPKQAGALISDEPPKAIANILSHLDSPQSILIFNHFPASKKKQITLHIDRPPLSETESRKLDQLLAKKISKIS
jgi:flagellar motor switch protein FliG